MKKYYFLFSLIAVTLAGLLLMAATPPPQTYVTPNLSSSNIFTGINQFTQGIIPGTFTVATLPAAPAAGTTAAATDGTPGTSPCTGSGGGALALYNGTNWVCFSVTGGTSSIQGPFRLENCTTDQVNTFFIPATETNYFFQHAEFPYNPSAFPEWFNCTIKLPHILPASGSPKIVIDTISAIDGTASHTMTFATCDNIVTSTVNVGALTCASTQNFSTSSTSESPSTLVFAVQSSLTADSMLVVQIKATAISSLATNVRVNGFYLEWQ